MKNDLDNEVNKKTRNQYAAPPRGNAIPAGPLSDFLAIFINVRGPKSPINTTPDATKHHPIIL